MEETEEKKSLWDFYNKCISEDNGKRAQCRICNNVYSYNSTIHNLKAHLYKKHKDVLPCDNDVSLSNLSKTLTSKAQTFKWGQLRKQLSEYFTVEDPEERLATCNSCKKTISFKTTTGNLKSHLRRKHQSLFVKLYASDDEETTEEDLSIVYDGDSEGETKLSEVRSCFEKETGGSMRCLLCRSSVPDHEENLRRHMKKHPKILNEQQDLDVLLQDDDDEQQDVFTEVVYLDEGNIRLPKKKEKKQWQYNIPRKIQVEENVPKSNKKKRRASSSSENETFNKSKNNEIRKFGDYIMCLLEKMPEDVCRKMQMNIINMIMNANLNTSSSTSEPIPIVSTGTVSVTTQSITPEYYVLENTSDKSTSQCTSTGTVSNDGNRCENQSYSITIAPSMPKVVTDSDEPDKFTLENTKNIA